MVPLTTAVDILAEYPELLAVLVVVIRAVRAWQTSLSWPEYRAIHRVKRGVLPVLDRTRVGDWVLLVSDKGGREDPEFVATTDAAVRDVVADLQAAGASLHLINALKRRPDTHGDPLTAAHLVWTIDDADDQVEAFLFANADGSVDIYVHTETAVDDPIGHLTDHQADGDSHGVVPDLEPAGVHDAAAIEHYERTGVILPGHASAVAKHIHARHLDE